MTALPTLPDFAKLPALPKLPKLPTLNTQNNGTKEQRRKPRITIDELNKGGLDAIRAKRPDVAQALQEGKPWWKSTYEVPLDILDIPRNVVANAVASIVGVNKGGIERNTLGMRRVAWSDILAKLGMSPGVGRGALGFVLDIAADPLTYLPLGATTGVKVAANVPKVLKPGVKLLENAARGGKLEGEVARAIAPRMAGRAGEVMQRLAKRQLAPSDLSRYSGDLQAAIREMGGSLTPEALAAAKKRLAEIMPAAAMRGSRAATVGQAQKQAARIALRNLAKKATYPLSRTAQARKTVEAASGFFSKFGEKGRTIARLPFAESGLTLPFGQRAQLYKELLSPERINAALNMAAKGGSAYRKLTAKMLANAAIQAAKTGALAEAKAGRDAMAQLNQIAPTGAVKNELAMLDKALSEMKVNFKAATASFTAKQTKLSKLAERAKSSQTASTMYPAASAPLDRRLAAQAAFGKAAKPGSLMATIHRNFGPGWNPLRLQELGIQGRAGLGSVMAGDYAMKQLAPEFDRLVHTLVTGKVNGITSPDVAKEVLFTAFEYPDLKALGKLHPSDAAIKLFNQYDIPSLIKRPDVAGFFDRVVGQTLKPMAQVGEERGVLRNASEWYQPRVLTRDAAKQAQAQAIHTGSRRTLPKGLRVDEPYNLLRTRLVEMGRLNPQTGVWEKNTITTNSLTPDRLKQLADEGWTIGQQQHEISAAELNRLVREGHMKTATGEYRGQWFDYDIPSAIGERVRQHEQALAHADLRDLIDKTAITIDPHQLSQHPEIYGGYDIAPMLPQNHPLFGTVAAQAYSTPNKAIAYPRPVTEMLQRFQQSFTHEGAGKLLRAFDWTMKWWKLWALMHPSYVLRNVFQNAFGTLMAGGDAINAAKVGLAPAMREIYKAVEAGAIDSLQGTIRIGSQVWDKRQLASELREFNILAGIRAQAEFAPAALRGVGEGRAIARGVGKFGKDVGSIIRRSNTFMEEAQRAGAYIGFRAKGMTPNQASVQTALAIPDLSNVTRLEKETAARIVPWFRWCVPTSHRALTRNGWKSVSDLHIGDDVLTYNVERDISEWQPIQDIARFPYNGTLMKMEKKTSKFLFTPEHRWPVSKTGKKRAIKLGYELRFKHNIPKTAPHIFPQISDITDQDAAAIGWLFTDGHMRRRDKGNIEAVIYQKKIPQQFAIRQLFADKLSGEIIDKRDGTHIFRFKSSYAKRLWKFCPGKESFPLFVTRLTEASAIVMWNAMMDAEGSYHPESGMKFVQNRGPVLVAFQMLSLLLNRKADTPGSPDDKHEGIASYCYISKERTQYQVGQSIGWEHFEGEVWCPVTANGTWMMEYNGRCIFTGNTKNNGMNQLGYYLMQQPAWMASMPKVKDALEQIFTTSQVPEELRPDWMREAGGAQVTGNKEGGQAFLLRSWLPWDEPMAAMQLAYNPAQAFRYGLSQVRPELKFALEQATGRDIFRGQPQEQMTVPEMVQATPKALVGRSGTAMDNLLAIRPLREAAVRVPEQDTAGAMARRGILGGAVQEISTEKGLRQFDALSQARLGELRRQIAYAREKGQLDRANELMVLFLKIMQTRRQMGLAVPKATETALAGAGA